MELYVRVEDDEGGIFVRNWKDTADRRDAIRWTIQSEDLPYYITGLIVSVKVDVK